MVVPAIVLVAFAAAFAGGYLTARLGRVPVVRAVGETLFNGDIPVVDLDEGQIRGGLISPTASLEGVFGSECVVPTGIGQRVEVGLVPAAPDDDVPGTDVAVWVKCLSGPTDDHDPYPPIRPLREPGVPEPGTALRYVGDEWLGSGSERLGVPNTQPGMRGTMLYAINPVQWVVEWHGGPTHAVSPDRVRVIHG